MHRTMTRLQRGGKTGKVPPAGFSARNNEWSAVAPTPSPDFLRKLRLSSASGVLVAGDGLMEIKQCACHRYPGCEFLSVDIFGYRVLANCCKPLGTVRIIGEFLPVFFQEGGEHGDFLIPGRTAQDTHHH